MKPSNLLFDIIKSLSSEEIKYFKKVSSLQQGEKNRSNKDGQYKTGKDSFKNDFHSNGFQGKISNLPVGHFL